MPKVSKKKREYTDKVLISFGFWVLCATSILFGIFGSVWYIASFSALQNGVQVLPQKHDNAFHDLNLYINNTMKQIEHLTTNNFEQVNDQFSFEVNNAKDLMVNVLKGMKDDIFFEDLINLSESIVQEILNFNNETIEKIKTDVGSLNATLEENIKMFAIKVR